MKKVFSILFVVIILYSCGGSSDNKTVSDAKDVAAGIQAMKPGTIATSESGWTMKAKINGKEWTAASIYPPDRAGRISGDGNGSSIGLPYDRRDMVVGKKINFKNNAVDLFVPEEDGGILGSNDGEMEITKVDDKWAEGTFHFKASSTMSDKKPEVTDGFFRISMASQQK